MGKYTQRDVDRQNEKKAALVDYKGGRCCICGYDKHNGALDFHHTGKKSFALGAARDLSLKRLKKEADKTILVCKNCHAEVHAGLHEKYK